MAWSARAPAGVTERGQLRHRRDAVCLEDAGNGCPHPPGFAATCPAAAGLPGRHNTGCPPYRKSRTTAYTAPCAASCWAAAVDGSFIGQGGHIHFRPAARYNGGAGGFSFRGRLGSPRQTLPSLPTKRPHWRLSSQTAGRRSGRGCAPRCTRCGWPSPVHGARPASPMPSTASTSTAMPMPFFQLHIPAVKAAPVPLDFGAFFILCHSSLLPLLAGDQRITRMSGKTIDGNQRQHADVDERDGQAAEHLNGMAPLRRRCPASVTNMTASR